MEGPLTIVRLPDGRYAVECSLEEFLARGNVCSSGGRSFVPVCPAPHDAPPADVLFGPARQPLARAHCAGGSLVFVLNAPVGYEASVKW